jgi:thioredoxin-like negative regulator of GroEL
MLGAMSGDGKSGAGRRPRAISRPRVPPGPLADLKALLYELYLQAGTPTLDQVAAWIAADEQEDLAGAPGRDTIARIIGDPGQPASQADAVAVATVLARVARWNPQDAAGRARDLWVAARMASVRYPAAGVRVNEADPRRLGVHAAISVPGVPDEVPPEYVPRDADDGDLGVRARVAAAAERGGFVLLVGGSSVGKTRTAFEAVRALLPEWWLAHPAGPGEVAALASAPTLQTVVWLDELQRYLDGEHGLTGGMVRALLGAPGPVVVIGTLWPDRYAAHTMLPAPGGADPRARGREVLDLATVIRIGTEFSPAEQDRARAAAAGDRRLQVALDTSDYGLTQTLAAAPQLVARWEDAQAADPYAWAVLTAALDIARLGGRTPLSPELLRAAAPGYCTPRQQAEARANWFEQALAYATARLHGAVAALAPTGSGMGHMDGYTVADYLIQRATRERRCARVPASTWDALLRHHRDHVDARWLADSAECRLLYCYAIPLYRRAADAGDGYAARKLAGLLYKRGDQDGLRAQADTGDQGAAEQLAKLLRERGDMDGLRARAGAGDGYAARELTGVLRRRGDLDGAEQVLRARAGAGDGYAARELAGLLYRRGDLDGAEQVLRARAGAGDWNAARELAGLLLRGREDPDGAEQILHTLADAGDGYAARELAWLRRERGDLDGLGARADAGDGQLVRLRRERGDLDGLRARVNAGDGNAVGQLVWLLRERGDLDEAVQILRTRADAGDGNAARLLVELLRERGDLDEAVQILRTRADAGDGHAARELAGLLGERGDLDEAEQILRARADAGDGYAAGDLAGLLGERGDLDEAVQILRTRADAGDGHAARQLVWLLREHEDLDEAVQVLHTLASTGDQDVARQLAQLLRERGDLDGLRALANTGDRDVAEQLVELLRERGDLDEAEQVLRTRADAGDWYAAGKLAGLLRERGDLDGLRALANTGDRDVAEQLARLVTDQGRSKEAERLLRFGLNPDGSIA